MATPLDRPITRIQPRFQFPNPGDGSSPSLWLQDLQRVGLNGSATDVALPVQEFGGVGLTNRVDYDTSAGVLPLKFFRVHRITDELGGQTSVSYGQANPCTRSNLPQGNADTQTLDCFPQYFVPDGGTAGFGWFSRYLTMSVTASNLVTDSPPVTTSYAYNGGAGWHYAEDLITPSGKRTWSDSRGYANVNRTVAPGTSLTATVQTLYFRGMHGDRRANGTTKSATLTSGDPAVATHDDDWLSGLVFESRQYEGASIAHRTVHEVLGEGTGLRRGHPAPTRLHGAALDHHRSRDDHRGCDPRDPHHTRAYTADLGLQTEVFDEGDLAVAGDDVPTCTSRASRNDPAATSRPHMADFPTIETVTAGSCTGGTTISRTDWAYDGAAQGVAPTVGDVTLARHYSASATSADDAYRYDSEGRVTWHKNPRGLVATTAFSPATGTPTSGVTTTNPKGQTTIVVPKSGGTLRPARSTPTATRPSSTTTRSGASSPTSAPGRP